MSTQMTVNDELTAYEERVEKGDQVYVRRRFRTTCSSPILSKIVLSESVVAVKAGTPEDGSVVKPTVEAWCVDRQP